MVHLRWVRAPSALLTDSPGEGKGGEFFQWSSVWSSATLIEEGRGLIGILKSEGGKNTAPLRGLLVSREGDGPLASNPLL